MTREFSDDEVSAVAVLGYMDEPSDNPKISKPILRFPATKLLGRGLLSGWGGAHTSWTLHDADPFRMFSPYALATAELQINVACEADLVAVMMPFDDSAEVDPVYRAIRDGVEKVGMNCCRVDELKTPTDITDDIRNLIAKSRLVIADLTDLNPNVMYELGYAEALGKPVVRICRDGASGLPFDVSHCRVNVYRRDGSGLCALSTDIAESVTASLKMQ